MPETQDQIHYIEKLMAVEPQPTCEIHAGTISYRDHNGIPTVAEFYVKTCADADIKYDEEPEIRAHRQDDLNQQYEDIMSQLMEQGCSDIQYEPAMPNPFF